MVATLGAGAAVDGAAVEEVLVLAGADVLEAGACGATAHLRRLREGAAVEGAAVLVVVVEVELAVAVEGAAVVGLADWAAACCCGSTGAWLVVALLAPLLLLLVLLEAGAAVDGILSGLLIWTSEVKLVREMWIESR